MSEAHQDADVAAEHQSAPSQPTTDEQRRRYLRRRLPSLAAMATAFVANGAIIAGTNETSSEGRRKGH